MKFIVFGTGIFFINRQDAFLKEEIAVFIDNDENKWGKKINGIPIVSPSRIREFSYDKIVLMSKQKEEMKRQLVHDLKVDEESILDFEQYCEYYARSKDLCELVIHYKKNTSNFNKSQKRVLIITHELSYSGGSLAAFYTALALKEKGFDAIIAAKKADKRLINEIINKDIIVLIQDLLDYCAWEQINWVGHFDYIIINTLRLWRIIKEIDDKKPLLWWIHESKGEYEYLDAEVIENIDNMNIDTYVVSRVAAHTFHQYFHKINTKLLCYGIPDTGFINTPQAIKSKMVFAVIGTITFIKGQDIFLQAITQLTQEERDQSEFWIIGACPQRNQYEESVLQQMKSIPEVKWLGELTREEMEEAYKNIDVVVVCSRQETMSIVMTEAFMYGKIGIASNATGIAEYMEDEENGLIFENEDATDLTRKMSWILHNNKKLREISEKARQTYEKYFTLKAFGDRIEKILLNK